MILVSGASGKTGKAILGALARRGLPARALVHREEQAGAALADGAVEAVQGSLLERDDLERALEGVETVYHICPNMEAQEAAIGQAMIAAAKKQGAGRLVYHSVLHPQAEAMPHHWNKLRVEEMLFTSGLPFTILQPCAYMQNVEGYWQSITRDGVYAVPYAPETRISVVDLEDVAEAAARVLGEGGNDGAIYELAGPGALSQAEIAQALSEALGKPVKAIGLDQTEWASKARKGGMAAYALESLAKMFEYYEQYGFSGNSRVLEWLLGRKPATFEAYLKRLTAREGPNG